MDHGHQRTARSEPPVMKVTRQYQKPRAASPDLEPISRPVRQNSPAIDGNQERQGRKKIPTVDEAIDWLKEQNVRLGRHGFSHGRFPTSDFFKDISVDSFTSPYASDGDVVSAMEQMHANVSRVKQQAEMLGVNKPLLVSVEREVDRRFLALSSSPEETKRFVEVPDLRRKIAVLQVLEDPIPDLPMDSVVGYVCLKPLAKHTVQANFPLNATVTEVYSLLKGLLQTEKAALSEPIGETYNVPTLWAYRFVLGSTPEFEKPAVPLSSDIDYRIMINEIVRKRIPRLTSVLLEMEGVGADKEQMDNGEAEKGTEGMGGMRQGTRYETQGSKSNEPSPKTDTASFGDSQAGYDAEDNIFDEDGNPYFDEGPIDWNKLSLRYQNGEGGLLDEEPKQGKQPRTAVPDQQQTSKYDLRPRRQR